MAKKMKKPERSLLNILFVILALSLFLFGTVLFRKNQENADVQGVMTDGTMKPPINKTAKAGEACGKSINKGCQKELICAPLMPLYKTLKTTATTTELAAEADSVLPGERPCLGKPESDIKDACLPFLPYYGACVKKGVWPPPIQKVTPVITRFLTPKITVKPTEQLPSPVYSPPPPETISYTPTPTSTIVTQDETGGGAVEPIPIKPPIWMFWK